VSAAPRLAVVDFSGGAGTDLPLLVLGPSLGTSVRHLWASCAELLRDEFRVVGWDLPGHGDSEPATGFDLAALGESVLAAVDQLCPSMSFHYAGDSLGGAVGLQLLLDAPDRLASATLLCTGARIGEPAGWQERTAAVRADGTETLLESAPARWFGPGFADRSPAVAQALLADLAGADDASYASACEALAAFDVRARLQEISTPILAVAGASDVVTPPSTLRHLATGVQHGRLVVLDGVAHLAPAEAPEQVARLIIDSARGADGAARPTVAEVRAAGMRVRREVLGDAHVDRATANATDLTAEFQDFITQYAWGSIWTRPGLDRRSRSLITLTALVARGHHEELAMHLRAARSNGLTNDEIKELLLQTAIYCGVPDANTAFRIAQQVLAELDVEEPDPIGES
jgi:3-oxoadipate enol-lactonase/4-carboxymuconolactone decarboxylase